MTADSSEANLRCTLIEAIKAVGMHFDGDQLAYLTLTSKPEAQIRDAIAWGLHRTIGADPDSRYLVAREWSDGTPKCFYDLAVVDSTAKQPGNYHPPAMLVEFKTHATWDFQVRIPNQAMRNAFAHDINKLRRPLGSPVVQECKSRFFVHISVTPMERVEKRYYQLVKYYKGINRAMDKEPDPAIIRTRGLGILGLELQALAGGGSVENISMGIIGEAFGIPVAMDFVVLHDF